MSGVLAVDYLGAGAGDGRDRCRSCAPQRSYTSELDHGYNNLTFGVVMVMICAALTRSVCMVCVPGSNSNHRDCGVMGSFVGVVDVAVAIEQRNLHAVGSNGAIRHDAVASPAKAYSLRMTSPVVMSLTAAAARCGYVDCDDEPRGEFP